MKKIALLITLWATLIACSADKPVSDTRQKVVFETTLGNITLAIDTESAPLAANYFLSYIDNNSYNGATLYRSAAFDGGDSPQLVQGGILSAALTEKPPINAADYGVTSMLPEWETTATTGQTHRRGSISLARDLLATGQVIPEIVLCLREIPSMDAGGRSIPDERGFPVIGEVVEGLDIVEAVTQQELNGTTSIAFLNGQILTEPVVITAAYRL